MRAHARLPGRNARGREREGWGDSAVQRLGGCALIVGGVALVGVFVIPGLIGAIDRGAQVKTMAAMRSIATALESHAARHGRYPAVDGTAEDLARALGAGADALPTRDGWRHSMLVRSDDRRYAVISLGCCGEPDLADPFAAPAGPTSNFRDDIVFADGSFIRHPDGTQR